MQHNPVLHDYKPYKLNYVSFEYYKILKSFTRQNFRRIFKIPVVDLS